MKRTLRFTRRYINGTKGVISLFLAILMLPFVSIGGALINAARVDSAVAVFDEALCNASNSTLGTYDEFLRKRFGLLAISQNTSSRGGGYTVQNLISDTFEYYMEQNVGVLSNTYIEMETGAAGVYPLADTGVLLTQVQEYGKYAIPAKLVMDGFCIDDIIASLSKNMNVAKNFLGTFSNGADLVQKVDNCGEKFDEADTKLSNFETEKTGYENAYAAFEAAADRYNSLVDEMARKVQECRDNIASAEAQITSCNEAVEEEAGKYPDSSAEWDTMKNEKDESGEPVDNSAKMENFEMAHEELKGYVKAQGELEDAQKELEKANENLETVIAEYQGKLDAQRGMVESAKSTYVVQIGAFAAAVKAAGDAVIGAQGAYSAAAGAGVNLVTSMANTGMACQQKGLDNQIEGMKKSQQAAKERGDNTAAYLWGDQINEAQAKKDELSDEKTLLNAFSSSALTANNAMNQFASEPYGEKFNSLYLKLIELKGTVETYTLADGYETPMPDTGYCFAADVDAPITKTRLEKIRGDLAGEIENAPFMAIAQALCGFIDAIASFSDWVDPKLTAVIDPNVYADIGGLPSSKARGEGSPYCLKSAYDAKDSQKSEDYKRLLGSYSGSAAKPGDGTGTLDLLVQIVEDIRDLSECLKGEWGWYNLFGKIKTLINVGSRLAKNLITIFLKIGVVLAEAAGQKILLAGYVAYNIPNRTTYTGSALTGGRYNLPNAQSRLQGYAFYGAEAEYIMKGYASEAENLSAVFNNVWLIRLIYDFFFVITNQEVHSIAGAAGSVTFGIGAAIVFILYFVAEPFVDTLVLVNGGQVPIWKSKLYLTPSGITDLIKAFYKLTLNEDQKNEAYQAVVKCMGVGKVSDKFAQSYADAYQSGIKDPEIGGSSKLVSSLTFDYTKTILFAMLFENKEKMLNRLADVIQMEASFYAAEPSLNGIGTYTFNLDQSYTYLRAWGSFSTNEFIPVSGSAGLKSKERVVYRGY